MIQKKAQVAREMIKPYRFRPPAVRYRDRDVLCAHINLCPPPPHENSRSAPVYAHNK